MNFHNITKLGAINKNTREYIFYKMANKKDEYICPDCNKEIILCKGEIRVPYFRHKIDTINPCNYYDKPNESQIHKDAKMLIKSLLEKKVLLSFIRNCICCKKNEEFKIPEIIESSSIHIEYRFEYNGSKIADVAYIEDDEILCIFEICNTHKTSCENRPEPWFEIDALSLINLVNKSEINNNLKIPCIRCEKCEDCITKEKINIKNKEKALDILYEWLKNGNEVKPFIFDYEKFSKVGKNVKSEFTNEIFDLMIYLGQEHEEGWERYCVRLIYDFEESYFIKELEYADLHIGVYYIDINWILTQSSIPDNINYIASLDRYSKISEEKRCKCGKYEEVWVKRFNNKVINIGCGSCGYKKNSIIDKTNINNLYSLFY
jgi:uncharacterized protein YkuJ